jgi:hypothetical protein
MSDKVPGIPSQSLKIVLKGVTRYWSKLPLRYLMPGTIEIELPNDWFATVQLAQ